MSAERAHRVVDCFIFSYELDLLELRLRTLGDVVDRFVLVEAPFTFRGQPKPLVFQEHAERFAPWRDRIVPLVYPGPPAPNPWTNEWGQRDFCACGLDGLESDDVVMISDCDEIPDPQFLNHALHANALAVHRMALSLFYVNLRSRKRWAGTRAFRYGDFANLGTLSTIRQLGDGRLTIAFEGGWHFTYLGGVEAVRQKVGAYAHAEFDLPYFTDPRRVELQLATGHDMTGEQHAWVPVDATFPQPLQDDPDRWRSFICGPPPPLAESEVEALCHAHGCFAYVPDGARRVTAISSDAGPWNAAGRERFGDRFDGVVDGAAALAERDLDWVVIDGLERFEPERIFAALRSARAHAIAFTVNARSFTALHAVASGAAYPPGETLGIHELRAYAQAHGFGFARIEHLLTTEIYFPASHWDRSAELVVGDVAYSGLTRETTNEMLTRAYLLVFEPR